MRWVPGVSIGEEGGKFWPWHRDRDSYFTIGYRRMGGTVVVTCTDCGAVLAAWTGVKGRKDAAVKRHDNLHKQLYDLHEQVAELYGILGIEAGEQDNGDNPPGPEGGYIEPGYDVREIGSAPDSGDDG